MKRLVATLGEKQFTLELSSSGLRIDGETTEASLETLLSGIHQLHIDGREYNVFCKYVAETQYEIWIHHFVFIVILEDDRSQLLKQVIKPETSGTGLITIRAPMPGLITAIEVDLDDFVDAGKGLLILEAMKMENEIRSTVRGRIKGIKVEKKTTVEKGQELFIIEPTA